MVLLIFPERWQVTQQGTEVSEAVFLLLPALLSSMKRRGEYQTQHQKVVLNLHSWSYKLGDAR